MNSVSYCPPHYIEYVTSTSLFVPRGVPFIKKLTASLLFIAVVMSFGVQSAFAESNSPKATVKNNVVTFSNLDQLKANVKLAVSFLMNFLVLMITFSFPYFDLIAFTTK